MADCVHDPVYSGEAYLTAVRRWAWICSKCGEFGHTAFEPAPKAELQRFGDLWLEFYDDDRYVQLAARLGLTAPVREPLAEAPGISGVC